jgi:hypothetical protein
MGHLQQSTKELKSSTALPTTRAVATASYGQDFLTAPQNNHITPASLRRFQSLLYTSLLFWPLITIIFKYNILQEGQVSVNICKRGKVPITEQQLMHHLR